MALKYKGVVAVLIGLTLVFGFQAVNELPLQLLPNTQRPQITIFNNWHSAAPQEVEEAIVQPQEIVYQDLIEEFFEPRLTRIPGVAQINPNARRPKEVNITVDPFRMTMMGVQVADARAA